MGMVIAAGAGLLIGFVLGEVAAALGLAVMAGLLVKFQELSRLVGSQQKQIAFLNKKLIDAEAEAVAAPAAHAEPSVQPIAAQAAPAPDMTSQTALPDSAPSVSPYVNEPT